MNRKVYFFTVLILFFSFSSVFASPRGKQELIESSSWIYDALTEISLEQGRTDFSDQSPLSIQEILLYLDEADYDSLSPAGKKLADRIREYCSYDRWSFDPGIFSLAVDPSVNVEGYYKSNDDIEWVYDRYSRKPLLASPVVVQCQDYFTMLTDLELRRVKSSSLRNDVYTNIPFSFNDCDTNFPDTGYFSTGFNIKDNAYFNFQIGKGTQSVGRSSTGSVIMSEYFTGASFANAEFFSPDFRYCMNVTQFNVDKYMYTHRIDVRFFKKLQFTAQESMLVYAPLELRFLNPWCVYHGLSPWKDYGLQVGSSGSPDSNTCAYMCFKASYVPADNFRIYGIFAQDQWQTQYEIINFPDDYTPNGIGAQLGVESFIPYSDGYIHCWLEGYYADPYMYIKQDPDCSLVRTYQEMMGNQSVFYEWVGNPLGPDTVAGKLSIGYEVPEKWSVTGVYLFAAQGEMSGTHVFDNLSWGGWNTDVSEEDLENWAYPNSGYVTQEEGKRRQALITPTGIPSYVNRLSVQCSWTPVSYITLSVVPSFTLTFNNQHVLDNLECGGEIAFSTHYEIRSSIK